MVKLWISKGARYRPVVVSEQAKAAIQSAQVVLASGASIAVAIAVGWLARVLVSDQDREMIATVTHAAAWVCAVFYGYWSFVLLRRCSRAMFASKISRQELAGYLCESLPVISGLVFVFHDSWLDRTRAISWSVAIAVAIGAMIWPLTDHLVVEISSALLLAGFCYAVTRKWARASRHLNAFPNWGSPLHALYFSPWGAFDIPGDPLPDESHILKGLDGPPVCFLSYRAHNANWARSLATELEHVGINVIKYDPDNMWKDAPSEIVQRIEHEADCIVHLGRTSLRSRWVRLERDWAKSLSRPVFIHSRDKHIPSTILRIRRAARVPMRSMGEFFRSSYMHDVIKKNLPIGSVRGSRAINRGFMGSLAYSKPMETLKELNKFDRLMKRLAIGFGIFLVLLISWLVFRG